MSTLLLIFYALMIMILLLTIVSIIPISIYLIINRQEQKILKNKLKKQQNENLQKF